MRRPTVALEVLGILGAGVLAHITLDHTSIAHHVTTALDGRRGSIYPALVGLEGALLGFTVTSLTIVLGHSSNPKLDIVRKSRHWTSLFSSFCASVRWSGYGTLTSLTAMFLDRDGAANLTSVTWLAVTLAFSVIVLARMLWVLHRIVTVITTSHERSPGN